MAQNEIACCDYVTSARDNQPKPLKDYLLKDLIESERVEMLTQKVRQHNEMSEAFKLQLPAVTWQSEFNGEMRKDVNAHPTGYFCLDVDIHHEPEFHDAWVSRGRVAAYLWAEQEARERAEKWAMMQQEEDSGMRKGEPLHIVAIHVSPSGTGVHVVAMCDETCATIAANQKRLARLLNTSYDEVCKDWARIFFIVPRRDWTYIDWRAFFYGNIEQEEQEQQEEENEEE